MEEIARSQRREVLPKMMPVGRRLWLWWVLASTVGWAVGGAVGVAVGRSGNIIVAGSVGIAVGGIKALAVMLFSVLLCLGSVVDARAQRSTTQGLVLGLDFGGTAASFENIPRDGAGLVGGRVGYGFNRILTLYLERLRSGRRPPGASMGSTK